MWLKIIGTGSKGNAYLLENDKEALLIECGVNIKSIKEALNFNISKLSGCVVTHNHADHSKSINDLHKLGVNTYATTGTYEALSIKNHRAISIKKRTLCPIGSFSVMPFDVNHDAADPVGFIINHKETGNILFLTDTFYSAYKFKNIHNIIIEANYSKKIIDAKVNNGTSMEFLRNRIIKSHMSLENCVKLLQANDLSKVNNIVLIHLSDTNSHEVDFRNTVAQATNKTVIVANNGMNINFNRTPF